MGNTPDVRLRIGAEGEQEVIAALKELATRLREVKSAGKETSDTLGTLKEGFKTLIEVIAVERLLEFGKEAFQAGLQIAKLSKATDIGSGTLSVYTNQANDFGVKAGQVEAAVVSLGTKTIQLQQGNERAAKSFALIGISASTLKGLNADQTLRKVTDAVAALPAGFQKTTAQEKLFGDGSAALTQTLDKLAGEGFDKALDEAKRFGTFLSDSAGKDFLAAEEKIGQLRDVAEGAARQFEVGLLPAVTDVIGALLTVTSGDNADGFKKIGETAGTAFKGVAFAVLSIGISAGTAAAETEETFKFAFEHVGTFAKNAAERIAVFFTKGLRAAQEFAAGQTDTATKEFNDRMAAIEKSGRDRQQQLFDSLFGEKTLSKEATTKKTPPPVDNNPAILAQLKLEEELDKLFQQHISNVQKQLTEELAIDKAFADTRAVEVKGSYEQGLIDLEDYYKLRFAAITKGAQSERDTISAEIANQEQAAARARGELLANQAKATKFGPDTKTGSAFAAQATRDATELAKANQNIVDLGNKQVIADQKEIADAASLGNERFAARLALNSKVLEIDKQILLLQGKNVAAADLELKAQEEQTRLTLEAKFGKGSDEVESRLADLRRLTIAQRDFDLARTSGEQAFQQLTDDRSQIELQIQSGQTLSLIGAEKIRQTELARIPILQAIADEQTRAAAATGTEADKQAARNFQLKVDQARVAAQLTVGSIGQIKEGLAGTALSSLQDFFSTGITGAHSFGEAFAGLADSVVGSLQKIVAQMLATILITKLLNAVTGFAGGGAVGGGAFGSSGLDNLPLGPGFAGGGFVPGSGSGDVVPAMLTPGEFVVRKSAVQSMGIATLSAINRGLAHHSIATVGGVQHFQDGGLVRAQAKPGDSRVHLHVSLDEGIVIKHMKSKAGGKVVVNHLATNPKAAGKAIGRSS